MENKNDSIQKRESGLPQGAERAKPQKSFVPKVDILENEQAITLVLDMPGVDEKSVDITLEKNLLAIEGTVESENMNGHCLAYREYETGNYHRTFSINEEIEKDKIEAKVKDGVLHLLLPKAKPVTKNIEVKAA